MFPLGAELVERARVTPRMEVLDVATGEVARVCRPGGVIGLCKWTPEGYIGQFLAVVADEMPPLPDGASPRRWGETRTTSAPLCRCGGGARVRAATVDFAQDSPEAFVDFTARWYGPLLAARAGT